MLGLPIGTVRAGWCAGEPRLWHWWVNNDRRRDILRLARRRARSAEAAEMDAKVAADPKLARRAEQHRALGAQLKTLSIRSQRRLFRSHFRPRCGRRRKWSISPPRSARRAVPPAMGRGGGNPGGRRAARHPGSARGDAGRGRGKFIAAASLDRALDTELASAPTGDVASVLRSGTKPARSAGASPSRLRAALPAAAAIAGNFAGCLLRRKARRAIFGWRREWTRASRRWSIPPWPASRSTQQRARGARRGLALIAESRSRNIDDPPAGIGVLIDRATHPQRE